MSLTRLLGRAGALALRQLDPERAHGLAIAALKTGLMPAMPAPVDRRLNIPLFDFVLPNPIGMAAGFDKNGEVPDAILALGFGFVEVGSITPKAQPGNPRPRVFRIAQAGAVINRFGFNGFGHAYARARLEARQGCPGVIGINVGANKDAADRSQDFVDGITAFADLASYLTINVSSPNTPGLRDLQAHAALDDLLARCLQARDDSIVRVGRKVPVLLKIAPDTTEQGLDDIAEVAQARGVDGLIVSNTTLSRQGIAGAVAAEAGGLSGKPLFQRSTIILAKMRQRVGRDLPILGVGGISDGADAWAKLEAGATALQLYTGFIYGGAGLAGDIAAELLRRLTEEKLASITAVTGRATAAWAALPIPPA